ncbi:uncharacterized protein GIQ15_05860 [Arthroderma uncinatum]|uniref:uncharacterized protein n=1 Tax=Arthroderma uncinatum TaxID=74035 RepID=UPI00144AB877|nr:uncharacterized protein GIQ15_05860 [Arthroderma uncinatum]KAF3480513.1 hypothetical protein GIQ15_05860 [Arthroderma uncinatum]
MDGEVIVIPQRPGCIAIGLTGEICKMDESYVVKHPKAVPGHPAYNDLRLEFMATERQIYERLGPHEGIIPYLGPLDDSGAIKLAYAKQGDLEAYISAQDTPSIAVRIAWIQSLMVAFYHIYSNRVLHQDVKLDNVLVDDNSLKIADFANGAIFPLDADMEKIYAEDPLSKADLLGIGYEVPKTEGLIYQELIDRCWKNEYHSIKPLYEDFQRLEREKTTPKENDEKPRVDFMLWFCLVPSLLFISGHYLSASFH